MLPATSKCFKRVLLWRLRSRISRYEHQMRSNCRNRLVFEGPVNDNRKLGLDRHVNECQLISSHGLQRRRYRANFMSSSILIGVSWIWSFFNIMNNSVGNCQSVATQASSSEDDQADELLSKILSTIESSPTSARETCTVYIEKLCRTGNLKAAARILQSLREKYIFLGNNAYNMLLEAAGKGNDIGFLSQIFKDLLVSNEPITSTSYRNIAKAFIDTNDSILLQRFVKEVSELTFPRSATVINRIIVAFGDCGQVDKALLIFDTMKSLKCRPDLVTYNTVLWILGSVGRADDMLHEFASMKQANIIPDIISYNTLINSLRKLGRLDKCLVFLKEMEERGLELDLRTYTALIETFGRSGNIEESLRLFNEMKCRHIRPSIYVYRSLINNLKKRGKLDLAKTFLDEMNKSLSDLVGPKDFRQKNR